MTAEYKRVGNNQVAVVNMKGIIDDIRTSYPHETFGNMAAKIGVTIGTVKTWYRTNRARKNKADALISTYPVPPPVVVNTETGVNDGKVIGQPVPLAELFDRVIQALLEIRGRLGV
jgi:hypothetical protein